MSADGEQVEDDADRIHKRAEDLEQFIRDTLLGARGWKKTNTTFPSVACLPASTSCQLGFLDLSVYSLTSFIRH